MSTIRAYTQGLLVVDGVMYESTGQRGESGVRIVDLTTGEVLKKRPISSQLFGGSSDVGGLLIQLTWTLARPSCSSAGPYRPATPIGTRARDGASRPWATNS